MKSADRGAQVAQLAARGLTRREIAAEAGISYGTVAVTCGKHRIRTKRDKSGWAPTAAKSKARADQMRRLYEIGYTLQQIGDRVGLTRERVRQLMTKHFGVTAAVGSQHRKAEITAVRKAAKRDTRSLAKWGCSYADYAKIRDMEKPTRAFAQQRRNSHIRGIKWEMSLWEWWCVWHDSGHWEQRGRGQGYVMSRIADVGPYALGNVYITTAVENSWEGQCKRKNDKTLPIGVRRSKNGKKFTASRRIGGVQFRLGTFETVEAAHAAWLRAGAPVRAAA